MAVQVDSKTPDVYHLVASLGDKTDLRSKTAGHGNGPSRLYR